MQPSSRSALVALSGGVDSSVCIQLLLRQGYRVQAAVLDFSPAHREAVQAAGQTAALLGVPLHVIKCHEEFRREVVAYFAASYQAGRTPNPCVVCNPKVKFELLTRKARELGLEKVATGHYAQVQHVGERWAIRRAACAGRDQSYMLYRLTQGQLRALLLPLAPYSKEQVRQLAAETGLSCASKPDSQEICFIPGNDYARYIEEHFGGTPPGDFISPEGRVCGRHEGILHYTVGQRKGLGVALGRPVFIRRIDPVSGSIYLAESGGEFSSRLLLSDCVYMPYPEPAQPLVCTAKVRSQAQPAQCRVTPLPGRRAQVEFSVPQRAPAPGQSCVFYEEDLLLGGGFIEEAEGL